MALTSARSRAIGLLATALTLCRCAVADTEPTSVDALAPDAISVFGASVSSLDPWPRSLAWGVSYRKTLAPYFAASLAYLNDGHFPGHHRDGITGEAWLPINLFAHHLTLSAGLGPYYYYDTVFARTATGYADAHGWAWMASLDAMIEPWNSGPLSHLFFELRLDHTAPARSIQTTSIGGGFGYRGFSDIHSNPDPDAIAGFADNEIVASYWKTVVNSFASQTTRAEEIEYRRKIWRELRASVGFLNEGDAQLIRRNGITAEGWAEPSFNDGLWSIGVGFGFYSAIDKYQRAPGRHISDIVSATASIRPVRNFDIRFTWHRIVTDYSRDSRAVGSGISFLTSSPLYRFA